MSSAARALRMAARAASGKGQGLYGLSNFSAANFMQSAAGGGEVGVASGFVAVSLIQLLSVPSATGQPLLAGGWQQYTDVSGIKWRVIDSAAQWQITPAATFTASDVGRIFVSIGVVSPSAIRQLLRRDYASPETAIVGYGSFAYPTIIGNNTPFYSVLAAATFRGVPSLAQLQAYCDAARVRGDLPESADGVTITHRWSLRDELRGVPNPAGRKTYGARGFNPAKRFVTEIDPSGMLGALKQWKAWYGRIESALTSTTLFECIRLAPSVDGWLFEANAAAWLRFTVYYASNSFMTSHYYVTPAVYGRSILLIAGTVGGVLQLFVDEGSGLVQVGSGGAPPPAYARPAGKRGALGGREDGSSLGATFASAFGVAGGDVELTVPEIEQLAKDVRATGRMQSIPGKTLFCNDFTTDVLDSGINEVPAVVLDRVGTNHLTRVGNLELAVDVSTGPACPAQLTDTTTRAAVDALMRQGSPAVRVIDPASDGRRSFGAQGFSVSSYLETAPGKGIRGSAEFVVLIELMMSSLSSTVDLQLIAWNGLIGPGGYDIWRSASTLYVRLKNASDVWQSFTFALTAVHLNRPLFVGLRLVGGLAEALIAEPGLSLAVFASAATTYLPPHAGIPMRIGQGQQDLVYPATTTTWRRLWGGNGAPALATLSEVVERARAQVPIGIPGLIDGHFWDPTQDVIASGVDAVPAVVLDRVGSDHLMRVGPDKAIGGFRGLKVEYPTSYLVTAPGSGFQGGTTAMTVSFLIASHGVVGNVNEMFVSQGNATFWDFRRGGAVGTQGLPVIIMRTTTGSAQSGNYAYQPGDLNKIMHFAFTWDGAFVLFYANGVQQGGAVALGGVGSQLGANSTEQLVIGAQQNGQLACKDFSFFGIAGGNYVATQAELAAQASASVAAGRLVPIPGRTDERRYNYDQDAVEQGTSLPGKLIDRMGHDASLVRIGSPLVLAPRRERLWSYEDKPILYGVNAFTGADYYGSTDCFVGNPAGFWYAVPFVVESQAVPSGPRILAGKNAVGGWDLRTAGTNSTISGGLFNAAGQFVSAATIFIPAADVGKTLLLFIGWDGSKIRSWIKRAEVGTGVALAGYKPAAPTDFFRLGVYAYAASNPATSIRILGFMGGDGVLSFAEVCAASDAFLATEDLVEVADKTDYLISVKQDVIENGGVLPAVLKNRKGAGGVNRVGNPQLAPISARAAAW